MAKLVLTEEELDAVGAFIQWREGGCLGVIAEGPLSVLHKAGISRVETSDEINEFGLVVTRRTFLYPTEMALEAYREARG